jgi:5-methylcytosine-specific restriction endonuclease McrA
LVASGATCICSQRRRIEVERSRPNARQRGYDKRWERESKEFLAMPGNRFCACGCGQVANMVDHRIPHKGDLRLFWDKTNWQPMKRGCNSRKAASHEGGFGNPIRPGGFR